MWPSCLFYMMIGSVCFWLMIAWSKINCNVSLWVAGYKWMSINLLPPISGTVKICWTKQKRFVSRSVFTDPCGQLSSHLYSLHGLFFLYLDQNGHRCNICNIQFHPEPIYLVYDLSAEKECKVAMWTGPKSSMLA